MQIISQEFIYNIENAPTPSCHASTIALHKGLLYAAWFGGTKEGADDVGIWLSINDGGWSAPELMSADNDIPHWNPVLLSLGDTLFLYYKKGKTIPAWQTFYRVLSNSIWSAEAELVPGDTGGRGPVKNKPLQLASGVILAPASSERKTAPAGENKWNAFIDVSDDGINWDARPWIAANVNLIQPSIWESDAGVHALMRSDAGAAYRSDSSDGGVTWGKAYKTGLLNNNSGLDVVYADGLYTVYNPVGTNWGARTPLVVSRSTDNGATWAETLTLEEAEGEYSYPSVIADSGYMHIVYTYNRQSIKYVKITL